MKIRNGFVSNSSSSSFCIVGVSDKTFIKILLEKDLGFHKNKQRGCDHPERDTPYCPQCGELMWVELMTVDTFGYGRDNGKFISFYGEGPECCYNAGLDAGDLLEKMTLPEAREYFQKLVKDKYDIDIPLSSIGLRFGEAGSG